MVRSGAEVRFHEGPPGFHQGSTRVPRGLHEVLRGLRGGAGTKKSTACCWGYHLSLLFCKSTILGAFSTISIRHQLLNAAFLLVDGPTNRITNHQDVWLWRVDRPGVPGTRCQRSFAGSLGREMSLVDPEPRLIRGLPRKVP